VKVMDWSGRVALVTGAGSGIGRATAQGFAELGARVAVVDRDEDAGRATLDAIGAAGGEAIYIAADVTEEESVAAAVAETVRRFGRLDAAHNNAGISPDTGTTVDCTRELWDQIFAVNVTGVWLCMKYEIEAMRASGGGAIVNTGSVSSLRAAPQLPAYVASKHALIGLTKVTALEYAAQNIRVNIVCPGVIETPMLMKKAAEGFFSVDDYVQSSVPMARAGQPEEIASAVIWACSDSASYLTGAALSVDGGMVIA
jgi:NAD(P)-dependent dehydrogenase (short-subunit alcohol dehydrogenase family)